MSTLTRNAPAAATPVRAPRQLGLEYLVLQAARARAADGLKLVYQPGLSRANGSPSVMCPCDNGPSNCVTSVPLRSVPVRLEGWLDVEFFAGQCPHCRRVYWG